MTREEFIKNFFVVGGEDSHEVWKDIPNTTSVASLNHALVSAIYDLQQQISDKDQFIEYLDQRLITLEQEVYK